LVHILRNSIDHGIEDEAQRMLEKKEHAGNVKLIFKRRSESVSVIVKDDGGGINPERIYEIAKEKKLIDSSTELSDSEKINLVLLPGFSTKEEITDLSGRGVGMDVVAKTIEGLHGSIKIDSQIGIGSEFCMNIPLSQSIFYGLISQVGEQKIIFRISEISRIVRVRTGDLESLANGVYHVRHEKRVFEVIHLKYFLNGAKELEEDREIFIVLTEVKGRSFGVLVDEIHNREKLVEKNIVFSVPDLNISIDQKCFSGVCLLSSSQIGSVLNLGGISQNFLRSKHAA
jgi:two-component system chemotaxis sensor kinase CheA